MPDSPSASPRFARILRRFFAQRLQADPALGDLHGHAQWVRHLTERALARAALRMKVHAPASATDAASGWKASLMAAALTELHAHK